MLGARRRARRPERGRDVLVRGRYHEVDRARRAGGRARAAERLALRPLRRRPVYLDAVASGAVPEGFGADDGVGLLFRDGRLERVVSSRPAAGCVRVKRAGGRAVEEEVHVDLLADREPLVAVDPDVRELRATRYRSSLRGGA
jgi:hypothetical protein